MSPSSESPIDVAIIGGGPAGITLSILLARRGYRVVVFERSRYDRPRAGETFGGELISQLQAIGLWQQIQNVPRTDFSSVRSNWGAAEPTERATLFNPFGAGWHVDRVAFDAALAAAAIEAGVVVRTGAGIAAMDGSADDWSIQLAAGERLQCRYVVDASGRGARAVAPCITGVRWIQMDRLVAVMGRMIPADSLNDSALEIEAAADGWWYTAPQPDGRLLVTLMTDFDLLPAGPRSGLAAFYYGALGRTQHIVERCRRGNIDGQLMVARADSGFLTPDHGDGWCAVGDAAMASDPLAGNGVVRGIGSAVAAAPRIAAHLDSELNGANDGESSETNPVHKQFADYLDGRAHYYLRESRFADAPFWRRRRPLDWRKARIFLTPQQRLHWDGTSPTPEHIAAIESLLPHRALRSFLQGLRQPVAAHQALAALRRDVPLEDRRLLVGVQDLIASGVVTAN